MSDTVKAALWMSGAILSFSSMAVAGRAVSFELDTFEIMMYRSFVGIFIVLSVGYATGSLGQITRRHLGTHLLRNLSHFTGQNLWFYALPLIPLAQLFALEFTSPLWVLMLSPLLLGERLTKINVLSALIGFLGVLLVARPGSVPISLGLITAAAAAIGFALSIIFTKRLTRSETTICILFYLTLMQAAFGILCAAIDGDVTLPSLAALPWLIMIGCSGLLAHFCLTTALSLAPATIVIPIDFIRLPLMAVVGALFYGEVLDIWILSGAILIFAGNYVNILTQSRQRASQ